MFLFTCNDDIPTDWLNSTAKVYCYYWQGRNTNTRNIFKLSNLKYIYKILPNKVIWYNASMLT